MGFNQFTLVDSKLLLAVSPTEFHVQIERFFSLHLISTIHPSPEVQLQHSSTNYFYEYKAIKPICLQTELVGKLTFSVMSILLYMESSLINFLPFSSTFYRQASKSIQSYQKAVNCTFLL